MGDAKVIEQWTDEQCKQLESIWILCQARRDAHYAAHSFFNRWHNLITLPSVLVGSILSTLSFDQETAPAGVSAGLAVFMTVMSTANTFFNLAKKTEGHRATHRAFNLLLREMEMSILRGQESPKREFIDFLEHINDSFTKLLEDAPTLNPAGRKILDEKKKNKPSPFDNLRGIGDIRIASEDVRGGAPNFPAGDSGLSDVSIDVPDTL